MLCSYDQVIQCNQTKKFLAQICGEAEITLKLAPLPTDDDGDILITEEDRARWEEERGQQILDQAEEKIRLLLGQRCSRAGWNDHINLRAKDRLLQPGTPASVRTVADVVDSSIPFTLMEKAAATKASAVEKAENDAAAEETAVAAGEEVAASAGEETAAAAAEEETAVAAEEETAAAQERTAVVAEEIASAAGETGETAAGEKTGGKKAKKPSGKKNAAPKSKKKKKAELEQGTDEEQVAARQVNGSVHTTRKTRSKGSAS